MSGSLLILKLKFKEAGFFIWSGLWLGLVILGGISVVSLTLIDNGVNPILSIAAGIVVINWLIIICYMLFREGYLIFKYGKRKTIEFLNPIEYGENK